MGDEKDKRIKELEAIIKAQETELRLFHQILDSIHEAVYVTDKEKRIIVYNKQFEVLEGRKKEEMVGKNENEAYMRESYSFSDYLYDQTKKNHGSVKNQCYYYTPSKGHTSYFFYDASSFFDEKGEIYAVYCIGRNMEQIGQFFIDTYQLQQQVLLRQSPQKKRARFVLKDIVAKDESMLKNIEMAEKVAKGNSSVMIIGETGTGKELFAAGVHNASFRANGPFIPINCSAIPETLLESLLFGSTKGAFTGAVDSPGLFEQAKGGTIFLDEINSMPYKLQGKLLRVLQDKVVRRVGSQTEIPLDCRIISASNVDPFTENREEDIRDDLLFRLSAIVINIPPLRERPEDIGPLIEHFLEKYNVKTGKTVEGISQDLMELFKPYSWPGNVREMENIFEGAMNFLEAQDKVITSAHIPDYIMERLQSNEGQKRQYYGVGQVISGEDQPRYKQIVSNAQMEEKHFIEEALISTGGNISRAAKILGLTRQNLFYRMKKHGLR